MLPHGPVVDVEPRRDHVLLELDTAARHCTLRPVPLPTREMRLVEYRLDPIYLLGPKAYPYNLRVADARRAHQHL